MSRIQLTLIQIDNYGPWTVTPAPRREVDLQTLQSRLYADLSQLIGNRRGYVFFTRFDNMIAVTNGLDLDDHALIQESIRNRYPISVSMSIASGDSPKTTLSKASSRLQQTGSAQDKHRTEQLCGTPLDADDWAADDVHIAHFDVNSATAEYTDSLDAFSTFIRIEQGYAELMKHFYEAHDGLSFFVGGDNVIAVSKPLSTSTYESILDHIKSTVNLELKVGLGTGPTAQDAGMAAKEALEECRHHEKDVARETIAEEGY